MPFPEKIEHLIRALPDEESARRFYEQFAEKHPAKAKTLDKNFGLLSDVLTLAAFSPLLSTTILQHPDYIAWLNRQRVSTKVRGKEELLESLARFALTNSQLETNVLLARFRRRELLRIYLQDIRHLETIAEITEEISNLADTILEYALRIARQELDNRYGIPLERDEKGRARNAQFCVVALGKLGSKELNYASDIDLLFLYSSDGTTSGHGSRGAVTNQQYFIKMAELIIKLVGGQTGEGAAYRVDSRLRPHGRVGALAITINEAVNYYQKSAQAWERQVLIRSRDAAGTREIFQRFFEAVESSVFSKNETPQNALLNVRLSKEKINLEKVSTRGFDAKLGKGGIREIEFIAQALQLAYGGHDRWLRAPHTLKSLARIADRNLLSETELTELADAYAFSRTLEHRIQMENGLQTHVVPNENEKRGLLARRMNFENLRDFDAKLEVHTTNVNRIFTRVFGANEDSDAKKFLVAESQKPKTKNQKPKTEDKALSPILLSLHKSNVEIDLDETTLETLRVLSETSPHFAAMLEANPALLDDLPNPSNGFQEKSYGDILRATVEGEKDFAHRIAALRKTWSRFLLEIVVFDVFEKLSRRETKRLQTNLAESSLETALFITRLELGKRFAVEDFPFAVLGLGKLGGRGMDYGSDLDLILVYDDEKPLSGDLTHAEFYSRAVEIFVTTLSAMTREGHLYRVDLRLRPDGKNGATSIGKRAFLNYLQSRAAIWEWLAYVKLRGVAGDVRLAKFVEAEARKIIHDNAQKSEIDLLRAETLRVRERLEEEKSPSRKGKEIDIKFGAGGMLDVYFAMRFLQLRRFIFDDEQNRSTDFMLETLYQKGALRLEDYKNFAGGYSFLSELDHNLRLTVGRSTRLPLANHAALLTIVSRLKLSSAKELLEKLTFHRLNIRASFENILKEGNK